jgi:putative ABC transport system permease protein
VSYRQLFAGDADLLPVLSRALEEPGAGPAPAERRDSQPSVARALRRAERFLLLAGSLA